jgi:hypothetical protein
LLCALGVLAATLLAAWAVPPLLNWGRYRTAIAAIAAAELGRPVVIGGEVTLRLLPEAVLTAADVTLPSQGAADGISAQVGALRLQVAIWPLLAGHIVLRDLVLGTPVLTLPWPLPDGLAHAIRPRLPHAFAAHVENGTLRIGGVEITGITAAIHGGPVPLAAIQGATTEPANVAVFGAEGFASFAARNWRFSSALGAPDADGVSAIDLSVHMLPRRAPGADSPGADTGGSVQATLADGIVQGRLRAGGPDLSQLMPASPLAWHLEAPFVASGERIETNAIRASLGGAPADGTALLQLGNDARLDARISAAAIDLDGWAALLKSSLPNAGPGRHAASASLGPKLPLRIALEADSATLFAGTLAGLRATLVSDGRNLSMEQIEATLPGNARLTAPHVTLSVARGLMSAEGEASLDAPDLAATLSWLQPLAPTLLRARPAGVLRRAEVSGTASLSPGHLAVAGLAGQVDGMTVAGGFAVETAGNARLDADLTMDRVVLDDWLGPPPSAWPASGLAALGRRVSGMETNLNLAAAGAQWGAITLGGIKAALHTGSAGLQLDHLEASLLSAHLAASGTLAADGAIAGAHMLLQAPDAQKMLALLPAAWRWAPQLWQGTGLFELAAEGPPDALCLQFRTDAGDLVLEAEAQADTKAQPPSATATITLRHPGTPRLLAALGLAGTETWLGTGSLALLAHLRAEGGHITVQDFTLDGAEMRLAGTLDIVLPGHAITGTIHADMLALPGTFEAWDVALGALPPWLQAWHAQLHMSADAVEAGLHEAAARAAADIALGSGLAFADDISAMLAGGHLTAQLALDTTQTPPRLALLAALGQATLASPLGLAPIDLDAGAMDLTLDLQTTGSSPQALWAGLSGEAHAVLRGGELLGLDLSDLARATALRPPRRRAAIQAALSQGATAGLDGEAAARIDHGHAQLPPATLSTQAGTITLQGSADLTARTIDLGLRLAPAATGASFGLHLSGPWAEAKAVQDSNRPQKGAKKK